MMVVISAHGGTYINTPTTGIIVKNKKINGKNISGTIRQDVEWFCTCCYKVFFSKDPHCCGEIVEFDLIKHGRHLIGQSNAWIAVWERWKYHPLVRQVSREWAEDCNFSSSGIINDTFSRIEGLLKGIASAHWDRALTSKEIILLSKIIGARLD